ncbi:MAG: hypothetical protein KatS3mg065_0367 [Chloroflexota bacterium]|nr:MAG: hypothetical protein KatS3mg065_0367 [Chloroflexota bacterium]
MGGDGLGPGPGPSGLLALGPARLEGQADDELGDPFLADDPGQDGGIRLGRRPPDERRQRPDPTVGIGDGEADPPLAEVDAEEPSRLGRLRAAPDRLRAAPDRLAGHAGHRMARLAAPAGSPARPASAACLPLPAWPRPRPASGPTRTSRRQSRVGILVTQSGQTSMVTRP